MPCPIWCCKLTLHVCETGSVVKRLIASKINVFVYIIYVSVLCIFIIYA